VPANIEELVRRSLEARAADVEPSPRTFNRVQTRIRRERTFRFALAGVTAAAAVLAAAVMVPAALTRPDVLFPPPAEQPGPDQAPPDPGAPPGTAPHCGGTAQVAAVLVQAGDVLAHCVNGTTSPVLTPPGINRTVAVAMEGSAALVERGRVGPGGDPLGDVVIVHVDLETGEEVVVGGGELPAFAPDGRVAWVQQAVSPARIEVRRDPFSEPDLEITVADDAQVRRLAWDTADDYLLYETVDDAGDSRVWAVGLGSGRHELLEPHDRTYFSPAVGPDGTIAVLSAGTRLELGFLDRSMLDGGGPAFEFLTEVGQVGDDHVLLPAGYVTRHDNRWVGADRPSWLVIVDGELSMIDADGRTYFVAADVESAAVNPAADLGQPRAAQPTEPEREPAEHEPEPAEPAEREAATLEPQALPHDVEVTRQRIHQAARARDFDALRALMAPEFTHSFGGGQDRDAAAAHLWENPDLLDVIAGLLELHFGIESPAQPDMFVWPWVYVDGPEALWPEFRDRLVAVIGEQQVAEFEAHGEYVGWRLGIQRDGTWRYFVAGD
jgi:hypothetical protein